MMTQGVDYDGAVPLHHHLGRALKCPVSYKYLSITRSYDFNIIALITVAAFWQHVRSLPLPPFWRQYSSVRVE